MKRHLVFILVLLIQDVSLLMAQEQVPVIAFDSIKGDAGKVADGEKIQHTFKITNKGTATLELLAVEPSCGCTSTKWPHKISPGQTGTITAEIATEGLTAWSKTLEETVSISKTIAVRSNDPAQPQIVLTLMAVVVPEFVLSQPRIFFGSVPKGQEATKEILVEISPEKPIRLFGATSTDDHFAARLEPVPGSDDKKFRIIGVQKATAGKGMHQGTILIKTSSQWKPELKIPVQGIVTKGAQNHEEACLSQTWREHLESREPLHGLDGRGPE
jgi:hypothetical protein